MFENNSALQTAFTYQQAGVSAFTSVDTCDVILSYDFKKMSDLYSSTVEWLLEWARMLVSASRHIKQFGFCIDRCKADGVSDITFSSLKKHIQQSLSTLGGEYKYSSVLNDQVREMFAKIFGYFDALKLQLQRKQFNFGLISSDQPSSASMFKEIDTLAQSYHDCDNPLPHESVSRPVGINRLRYDEPRLHVSMQSNTKTSCDPSPWFASADDSASSAGLVEYFTLEEDGIDLQPPKSGKSPKNELITGLGCFVSSWSGLVGVPDSSRPEGFIPFPTEQRPYIFWILKNGALKQSLNLAHALHDRSDFTLIKDAISSGAEINPNTYKGHHAQHYLLNPVPYASDDVRYLLRAGVINVNKVYGADTLLSVAIERNATLHVQMLLQEKADLNMIVKFMTPLQMAMWKPQAVGLNLIRSLIKHKANVNCKDFDGCTLLHKAVLDKKYSIALYLVGSGADHTIKENRGKTLDDRLSGRFRQHPALDLIYAAGVNRDTILSETILRDVKVLV